MNNKRFSLKISVFHGYKTPKEGILVGYGAIIEAYNLAIPLPNRLALISQKKNDNTQLKIGKYLYLDTNQKSPYTNN